MRPERFTYIQVVELKNRIISIATWMYPANFTIAMENPAYLDHVLGEPIDFYSVHSMFTGGSAATGFQAQQVETPWGCRKL